jgi:hypothetical protein
LCALYSTIREASSMSRVPVGSTTSTWLALPTARGLTVLLMGYEGFVPEGNNYITATYRSREQCLQLYQICVLRRLLEYFLFDIEPPFCSYFCSEEFVVRFNSRFSLYLVNLSKSSAVQMLDCPIYTKIFLRKRNANNCISLNDKY